jgi:sugar lactone lactonase
VSNTGMVRILDETPCLLGEGPSFDAGANSLFWFDILARKLFEHPLDTGQTKAHDLPFMASALFSVDAARQMVLAEQGLYLRDRASGKLTLHTPVEAHDNTTRSNDARAHPCGAIWLGTMGLGEEAGAGSIYHFYRGTVRILYANITIPNSICFSPDGKTAYFTDTVTGKLMRVAIDPQTALPVGEPELFFENTGDGWIDGSICDADGNVWNARWGAGKLVCHAPDGKILKEINIEGSPQTSCPAFIGRLHDRMIVTSASKLMSAEALDAAPHAGKTFLIDHPVKGRPEPAVHI